MSEDTCPKCKHNVDRFHISCMVVERDILSRGVFEYCGCDCFRAVAGRSSLDELGETPWRGTRSGD